MPTTQRDAQALTYLARRLREETPQAREWDENGTYAVISRLIGHNLPMVVERVTRHASDPEAKTPGAIERPFVPDAPKAGPVYPPKAEVACRTCGKEVGQCPCPAPKLHSAPVDHEAYERGAGMARALLDQKRGVPHHHAERVDGCFRCELSADESHPQHEATDTKENESA